MESKSLVAGLVVSLSIVMTACVGTPSSTTRSDPPPSLPSGLRYGDGNYLIHLYSKAAFPPKVGEWVRFDAAKYDDSGRDISVAYARVWGDFVARADIYVYPTYAGPATPALLRSHYQKVKGDVFTYKQDVVLLAEQEGVWHLPSGDRFCISAIFDLKMSGRKMASYLFLFGQNDWFILWRISHPAAAIPHEIPKSVTSLVETIDYSIIQ